MYHCHFSILFHLFFLLCIVWIFSKLTTCSLFLWKRREGRNLGGLEIPQGIKYSDEVCNMKWASTYIPRDAMTNTRGVLVLGRLCHSNFTGEQPEQGRSSQNGVGLISRVWYERSRGLTPFPLFLCLMHIFKVFDKIDINIKSEWCADLKGWKVLPKEKLYRQNYEKFNEHKNEASVAILARY